MMRFIQFLMKFLDKVNMSYDTIIASSKIL